MVVDVAGCLRGNVGDMVNGGRLLSELLSEGRHERGKEGRSKRGGSVMQKW